MAPSKQSTTKRKHNADGTPSSAKRIKSSFASPLNVLVGPKKEAFFIHEDVICARSAFFETACSKTWRENQEKTVKLPESNADDFRTYLDWAYNGEIDIELLQQHDEVDLHKYPGHLYNEAEALAAELCHKLCRLWAQADYLQDEPCKTEVMRIHLEQSHREDFTMNISTVQFVCSNVPHESGLFRWLVDYHSTVNFSEAVDDFPGQFQVALLKKFSEVLDLGEWPSAPDVRDLDKYVRKT